MTVSRDMAQTGSIRLRRPKDVDDTLEQRIAQLTKWLEENAPDLDEQRHLDEGSRERAYWHYGYLVALRDLRNLLRGRQRLFSLNTEQFEQFLRVLDQPPEPNARLKQLLASKSPWEK